MRRQKIKVNLIKKHNGQFRVQNLVEKHLNDWKIWNFVPKKTFFSEPEKEKAGRKWKDKKDRA